MGEMERCLLVWVSATSFQILLDNEGDGMLSPFSPEVVSPVYNFSAQVDLKF